jgi:hypothetical protein
VTLSASRGFVASGVIVVAGLAVSLISDQVGNYYLWSLLARDDDSHLCNVSLVARIVFVLFVAMELTTISSLIVLAFHRDGRPRKESIQATTRPSLGMRSVIALGLLLLFLHLGLYAIAFYADDVCSSTSAAEWLHHYAALVSFAVLYCFGAATAIGLVMLVLKRKLLNE